MKAIGVLLMAYAVVLIGCSSGYHSLGAGEDLQMFALEKQMTLLAEKPDPAEAYREARVEAVAKGNSLKKNIDASSGPLRKYIGAAKSNLVLYGALAIATGTITTTLVEAYIPKDTKVGIGAAGAVVTAIIGILQTVKGASNDNEEYVKQCDEAVESWATANVDVDPTIADKTKREKDACSRANKAYIEFQKKASAVHHTFSDIPGLFEMPGQ